MASPVVVAPLADLKRLAGERIRLGDPNRFVLLTEVELEDAVGDEPPPYGWSKPWHLGFYTERAGGIIVEPGFVTDFASIPPPLNLLIKPIGRYAQAAVLHDFGYYTHFPNDRRFWDGVFWSAMREARVRPAKLWLMWVAVRWFGGRAWKKGPRQTGKVRDPGQLIDRFVRSHQILLQRRNHHEAQLPSREQVWGDSEGFREYLLNLPTMSHVWAELNLVRTELNSAALTGDGSRIASLQRVLRLIEAELESRPRPEDASSPP